jgi:hypothetical protein
MTALKKYRRPDPSDLSSRIESLLNHMETRGIAMGEEVEHGLPPVTPEEFRQALVELVLKELEQHEMGSAEQFLQAWKDWVARFQKARNELGVPESVTKA